LIKKGLPRVTIIVMTTGACDTH